MIQGQAVEAACQPARKPWQADACRKCGCSACGAAGPAFGQKVVYGCMQGTGVIFRDTVTVSGCLLLRPLRLPAAWRHPVVRPDSDRQLLAHRQSPPNPLARFRAVATVRCVKTGLAATVPVAPPLSRRDLRSLHT
ncbi:hypothetical protein [Salmonella enterica]|uniref:hypothetical protein n=1 Tax=Salmonella enterica TaxID=28901 RepID=UPI00398C652F